MTGVQAMEPAKPNVIIIYADDMGYGDVQALNPKRGSIKTPHLDSMAAEGMTFTGAHTTSPVCSPSRYGLLAHAITGGRVCRPVFCV